MNVLMIGATLIGDDDATGQTLANVFLCMEHIRILQLCLDYDPSYHTQLQQVCYINSTLSFAFSTLKRLYRGKVQGQLNVQAQNTGMNSHSPIVALLKGVLDELPHRFDKQALLCIQQFKPEVIYSQGENIATLKSVKFFAEKYRIPVVLHYMDNVEDTIYTAYRFQKVLRKTYMALLQSILFYSKHNLAIGPKMAEVFSARHNKPFSYAMNCISELHYQPKHLTEARLLIFSGGLHGGRAASIRKLDSAIAQVNSSRTDERRIAMAVYTSPAWIKEVEGLSMIRAFPYVEREKMYDNLSRADVLVHVESFEERYVKYFEYSMSTKIPECLSLGRPILVFGDERIATVEYVRGLNIGEVVSKDADLVPSLTHLLDMEDEEFQSISARALAAAQRNHMKAAVQTTVYSVLSAAVKKV